MKIWSFILVLFFALTSFDADAARFGGGRSVGKQSNNVTQREVAPKPATPAGAAAAQGAAAKKPWGSMLGGLAAGLGLAWLAHSLGLGAAFGNILLIALLAFAALAAWGWYKRSRAGGANAQAGNRYAYQGAQGGAPAAGGSPAWQQPAANGNLAARTSSSGGTPGAGALAGTAAAAGGSMIGSALRGQPSTWDIPPGFDSDSFVKSAKAGFVTMQSAWDRSDLSSLRSMMTDEMLAEIRGQLAERDAQVAGRPNHTEVVTLNAELLGIEDLGQDYMASVEFTGTIREDDGGPNPFREVWNMTKPKSGSSGWLVAGVQALQ